MEDKDISFKMLKSREHSPVLLLHIHIQMSVKVDEQIFGELLKGKERIGG